MWPDAQYLRAYTENISINHQPLESNDNLWWQKKARLMVVLIMALILVCTRIAKDEEEPGAQTHLILGIWDVADSIKLNTDIDLETQSGNFFRCGSNYDSLWFDFSCEIRIDCRSNFCINFPIFVHLGIGLSMMLWCRTPTNEEISK